MKEAVASDGFVTGAAVIVKVLVPDTDTQVLATSLSDATIE